MKRILPVGEINMQIEIAIEIDRILWFTHPMKSGCFTLRLLMATLLVSLLFGCADQSRSSSDGYDELIGKGEELTSVERQRIWEYLLHYADPVPEQRTLDARERLRIRMFFERIGVYQTSYSTTQLYSMNSVSGETYHVVTVIEYPFYYHLAGPVILQMTLLKDSHVVSTQRMYLKSAYNPYVDSQSLFFKEPKEGLGDLLYIHGGYRGHGERFYFSVLEKGEHPEPARLGVVRVSSGNDLRRLDFTKPFESPSFPSYPETECERILKEGSPLEQCELLLWLSSQHRAYEKRAPGPSSPFAGSDPFGGLSDAASDKDVVPVEKKVYPPGSADALREYVREQELLKHVMLSENLWVQQAAIKASEIIHDSKWKMQFKGQIPDQVLTPERFRGDPFAGHDPFGGPREQVPSAQEIHQ